jgi:hypothetical protein
MTDANERTRPDETPAERIDPSEAAYLAHLNATAQRGQQAQVALGTLGAYLAGKYGLGRDDTVKADGTIARAPVATPPKTGEEGPDAD